MKVGLVIFTANEPEGDSKRLAEALRRCRDTRPQHEPRVHPSGATLPAGARATSDQR